MAASQKHSSSSKSFKKAVGGLKTKGENFYHNGNKLKALKMRREGKPIRDKKGNIVKAAAYASSTPEAALMRIQPDRRWFGNTRVVGQKELEKFREELTNKVNDPFMVLIRQNKIPMSLLNNASSSKKANLLNVEGFQHTFGSKSQRRKPKILVNSIEELATTAQTSTETKSEDKENTILDETLENSRSHDSLNPAYQKGQSKRIWNELYKVIDSSDVVVHVLDARNPLGTRCKSVEEFIKKEAPHKHLIFVLNKCDLIPNSITSRWVRFLSKEHPTIAFRASINNPFGKGALIQLLRQFSKLHQDKKQISVGFIGYPNTGKSSIINALRKKAVCSVAPIPGQTKVWQYVTLMNRIYLIDCPGIVPISSRDDPTSTVLKGVVRVENLDNPEDHIGEILKRANSELIAKTYPGVTDTEDPEIFLSQVATLCGKLLKGGNPDISCAAKMVLNDWTRGKIPYFVPPPDGNDRGPFSEPEHIEEDTERDN
jgi:nuclear GTP-binding protein